MVEYQDGNYPGQVCFTAFGNDKVADLDKYQAGDSVKVAFNLRAREYNGRWYNDVRVWRLSPAGQEAPQAARQPQQSYGPAPQPGYGAQPQTLLLRQSTTCRRTTLTTTCRSKNEGSGKPAGQLTAEAPLDQRPETSIHLMSGSRRHQVSCSCVMTSVPLDETHSLFQRNLIIKIFKDFLVADGLQCLAVPVRQQGARLLDKPLIHHIQHPAVYS